MDSLFSYREMLGIWDTKAYYDSSTKPHILVELSKPKNSSTVGSLVHFPQLARGCTDSLSQKSIVFSWVGLAT